jgi:hypothetical protein
VRSSNYGHRPAVIGLELGSRRAVRFRVIHRLAADVDSATCTPAECVRERYIISTKMIREHHRHAEIIAMPVMISGTEAVFIRFAAARGSRRCACGGIECKIMG